MWLLWFACGLLALRWFAVGPFARLSWWWLALLFALVFVWFEVIEPRLGLQQKKAMDEMDAAKKARIKSAIESVRTKRSRR